MSTLGNIMLLQGGIWTSWRAKRLKLERTP